MFGSRTLPFALTFGITWSPFGYAAHKRPEGQNLWGCDRSAVDFEVEAPGVVGPAGGQPALVSKVLAGSPRRDLYPTASRPPPAPSQRPRRKSTQFIDARELPVHYLVYGISLRQTTAPRSRQVALLFFWTRSIRTE